MRVTVRASARLHFGFIDLDGSLGRMFGSIGLAIEKPAVILEASPADHIEVIGRERGRVLTLARRFLRHYKIHQGVRLSVTSTIPAHAGLGSGTQLTLSVASVLARLFSIDADIRELASAMGRGHRSGIGIASFEQGGFIVDAGRKTVVSGLKETEIRTQDLMPPTIVRYQFPEEWIFVVAIPHVTHGLAGAKEVHAFDRLTGHSGAAGRLSRIVLMQMLPSVVERDPVAFGKSLTTIQHIVGSWFRSVQGGIYATAQGAELARSMRKAGALGVGQSSWGPAVYGLAKDQEMAKAIMDKMGKVVPTKIQADLFPVRASNHGAEISLF